MDFPSIASTAALALAGWALKQAARVAAIEQDVAQVRTQVNALYNQLVAKALEK